MATFISPPATPNHTFPDGSPNHLALRAAVRGAKLDDQILRTILWLINASDLLHGIRRTFAHLLVLVTILRKIAGRSPEFEEEMRPFGSWEPVLRWVSSALPPNVCPKEDPHSGNPNERDVFKRNPLWSDLWETAPHLEVMQAQMLYAHVHYLYSGSYEDPSLSRAEYERYGGDAIWPALSGMTYEACLALRRLCDPKWGPVLAGIPRQLPPSKFLRAFTDLKVPSNFEHLSESWDKHRGVIRSFLAQANGFEPWSHRTAVNGQYPLLPKPSRIEIDPASPGDPDDPDTRRWPEGHIGIITAPLSDEMRKAAIDCDIDEGDVAGQQEYYLAAGAGRSALRQLAINRAIAVRGQYRHVRMQHQMLPFDYAIPAAQEVRALLTRLDKKWQDLRRDSIWTEQTRTAAETIALIGIELWFGVSLPRALTLIAVQQIAPISDPSVGFGFPEGTLLYDRSNREWIVPVDPPPYRSVRMDPAGQAHRHLRWLPLQDTTPIGEIIDTLVDCGEECSGHSAPVFRAGMEVYERLIREFLRIDPTTQRITLQRLGFYVSNRMVTLSGDLMAAALITGRFPSQTRSERFYASYPVTTLRLLHWRAADRMRQITGCASIELRAGENPAIWAGHVGARLCANDESITDAIRTLKEKIKAVRHGKRKGVEAHNLLTLYSVLMFGFSTSCRPTRIPYIGISRVDQQTRFVALSDKDDDAHHKLRLVYIPELCWQQMCAYERYRVRLAREHAMIRGFPEPCFFVDGSMQPLPVRHASIAKHLGAYIKLPLNFYRVYMRHRLLEANTPPEIVMAWLGHAFAGEELWDPFSTLSPSQYRTCIDRYLEPILKELGWEVLS